MKNVFIFLCLCNFSVQIYAASQNPLTTNQLFDEINTELGIAQTPNPKLNKKIEYITLQDLDTINFSFKLFSKIFDKFIFNSFLNLIDFPKWMDKINPFLCGFKAYPGMWQEFETHKIFYAQKLFINPNTKILAISDFHANLCTLHKILYDMREKEYIDDNLKLTNNYTFVGLGDYTDRGGNTLKSLCILLLLAIKNPGRCILLRGNHETLKENRDNYDLDAEINREFPELGDKIELYDLIIRAYELMPSVLYLGAKKTDPFVNDLLQFSHGLADFKFDPRQFFDLDDIELTLNGGERFCQISRNIPEEDLKFDPTAIGTGFVWHDIEIETDKPVELGACNRFRYSPAFVSSFFRRHSTHRNKVCGLVGGHQHELGKVITEMPIDLPSSPTVAITMGNFGEISCSSIDSNDTEGRCFPGVFSIIKFVSGPIGSNPSDTIMYYPTYLNICQDEGGTWNFKAIECR